MTESTVRATLAANSEAAGWQRKIDDRVDLYLRGDYRVRIIWQGDDTISGASRFHDGLMETYTRELRTIRGWLA